MLHTFERDLKCIEMTELQNLRRDKTRNYVDHSKLNLKIHNLIINVKFRAVTISNKKPSRLLYE